VPRQSTERAASVFQQTKHEAAASASAGTGKSNLLNAIVSFPCTVLAPWIEKSSVRRPFDAGIGKSNLLKEIVPFPCTVLAPRIEKPSVRRPFDAGIGKSNLLSLSILALRLTLKSDWH